MIASDLIDRVSEVCGGYYSRAKILSRANGEQNKILGSSCAFMCRWVEMTTVAGQLSYALPTVNSTEFIRSVSGAYTPRPLLVNSELVPSIKAPVAASDGTFFRYKINGVRFTPADPVTGGGTLIFSADPGAITIILRVYVWPTQLLLESDTVALPDEFAGLLEVSVTQLLYDRGYGNSDNLARRFKEEKRAWSVFLSPYTEVKMGRPAWGFTSGQRHY